MPLDLLDIKTRLRSTRKIVRTIQIILSIVLMLFLGTHPLTAGESTTVPATVSIESTDKTVEDEVLIFSFFRTNGKDGIFLAKSENGISFSPLNGDKPVMEPARWEGQNIVRDPSIFYHDGLFHVVWTSELKGNCFGYASSKDLVTFSKPVQVTPFPQDQKQPGNVWAPEITWDPIQKNFIILFSSGAKIYITRTTDGKTFTSAEQLLDQKFGCIDGALAINDQVPGSQWVFVYKNKVPAERGGKNLWLATAPLDFSTPLQLEDVPFMGMGTKILPEDMVEGPCLIKQKDGWYLYADAPLARKYAMAFSPDLKNWTDMTDKLNLPPDLPRHGTIFRAPRSAVGWLNEATASSSTSKK